jgi:8-oxo-dGTP pyrophosphatase MutT (NUDIX family)
VKEAKEEVGIIVDIGNVALMGLDTLGAMCSWDLYYWVVEEFEVDKNGPLFHDSEADEIVGSEWVSFEHARKLALDPSKFSESRSARMLLSYLNN